MSLAYAEILDRKLDALAPGIDKRLTNLGEYPTAVQREVVVTLLGYACASQNIANITAAQNLMASIPPSRLNPVLEGAVRDSIDLGDEWEYRRLLELLRHANSEFLAHYVAVGLASDDGEIREAAADFERPLYAV